MAVIPTLLTLGNLICGFLAIIMASQAPETRLPWHWTPLTFAALFVFLGMVFDALDGRVARLMHQTSKLGEQLDSMADMVTFGAAPAFIAIRLAGIDSPFLADSQEHQLSRIAMTVACIYVVCAALRLARFNIEIRSAEVDDHLYFKGLPSPAAAGTVASLVLLHQHFERQGKPDFYVVIGVVTLLLLTAFAMVSRVRYVHLMNRYFRGRASLEYVAWTIIAGLSLFFFPQYTLAAGFVLYFVSGPALAAWQRLTGRRTSVPAGKVPVDHPAEGPRPTNQDSKTPDSGHRDAV